MGDIFLGRPLLTPKHRLTSGNIDTLNYFWSKGRFERCLSKTKKANEACVYFLCSHAEFSLPKYTVMSETKGRIDCSQSKKRTETGQSPQIALPRPRARLQAPLPPPPRKKVCLLGQILPGVKFFKFFLGRRLLTKTSVQWQVEILTQLNYFWSKGSIWVLFVKG